MKIDSENYSKLSDDIKNYVRSVFTDNANSRHEYHNFSHTSGVVAAVNEISTHYKLNERDLFIVNTAAWFHDIGYFTVIENHEEKSAAIAEQFLKEKGLNEETVTAIRNCILATRIPQRPNNLLEQIICDADLFHLGTDEFIKHNKEVRKESEELTGKKMKKKEWL